MKKLVVILSSLLLTLPLVGCSSKNNKIYVYAAASMTETLNKIKVLYEEKHDVKIVYNFASSGTLQDQIINGANCDLFISAAPKQMNKLEEENLIDTSSRIDLLENKVALVVPDNNPKNVISFDDLASRLKAKESGFILSMGDSSVPVGQYTQKIFNYYEINESDIASHLNYCTNVKAVASSVKDGGVACGIVYQTDAFSNKLTKIDTATKEMCGQVIYPAAIVNNGKQKEKAKEFLSYLTDVEAGTIFEEVGFTALNK